MFSSLELGTIKKWAIVGKDILKDHLNSAIFTYQEKEDKRKEYIILDDIMDKADEARTKYVSLDADHLGHLLVVLEKYREVVRKQVDNAVISTEDYAVETYQIGYIQGRAELGLLTIADIELIDKWELEIE